MVLLALSASFGIPGRADAQAAPGCEPARRVLEVSFAGSPRFEDDTLAATVATRGAPWYRRLLGFGEVPCADTTEVRADAIRIAVLHRRAGWFTASVTPRYVTERNGVRIHFDIMPGPEAILDSLAVTGLPSVLGGRPADARLRALVGQRFDRGRVEGVIAETIEMLRTEGHARAQRPSSEVAIDTASAKVNLALEFRPGPVLTIGEVHVESQGLGVGRPVVDSAGVMRLIDVRPGMRFSASALLSAQRDLYRSEAFGIALIDTAPARLGNRDSTIDVRILVSEARTRYARTGAGWATQDCMRVQGRITDRRFLGVGRRVELNARASKIGVGAPADIAPALCSYSVRADTFSLKLNYFVGVTLSDARLFGAPISPVLNVYSERRSEPFTYLRETTIGTLLEFTRALGARTIATAGLQYENGRTETSPVISCSFFAQCRPEDYEVSLFGRGVGIVSTAVTHDRTNSIANPVRGERLRAELRAGQTVSELVPSLRFYRTTGEGSAYRRLLGGVIATRLQLSRAFAPGGRLVEGSAVLPQQERLFAGGQNSVRGFQQNLLGPLVYVVDSVATIARGGGVVVEAHPAARVRPVPRGGTALVVANLEYRHALPGLGGQLQGAAFVDAGNVWETDAGRFRRGDFRATPGLGLRLVTPLGPFRIDVGYNPYPPRPGAALYPTSSGTAGSGGTIRCASPGNSVFIDRASSGFACPESYQPARQRGVLSRLVFHFGLGQAF